jgi:hypothetical protein
MADKYIICPGCGLSLKSDQCPVKNYIASCACLNLYWEFSNFTLSVRDQNFPHQLAVDTYAAQHYGAKMKPVTITFALIGLHLAFERGYTGREVQDAHVLLGKLHERWPGFTVTRKADEVNGSNVLQNISKDNYGQLLAKWGKSVWDSWKPEHENVRKLVDRYLKIS